MRGVSVFVESLLEFVGRASSGGRIESVEPLWGSKHAEGLRRMKERHRWAKWKGQVDVRSRRAVHVLAPERHKVWRNEDVSSESKGGKRTNERFTDVNIFMSGSSWLASASGTTALVPLEEREVR